MPDDEDVQGRKLLEQWLGGDKAAGEALARRYYPSIQKFLARRLGPQTAADLAQEVILAVVEKKDSLADIQSIKGYLIGVARFKLFAYLRAQERAPDELESQVDPVSGASSLLGEKEDRVLLLRALRTLSVEDQQYLMWFHADGLTQREIADLVGRTEPHVRGRIHRARMKLKEKLEALSRTHQQRRQIEDGFEHWLSTLRRQGKDPLNDDS